MNSVIKGAGYVLVHTPEMVVYNGTTQTTERVVNPESEYLKEYIGKVVKVLIEEKDGDYIKGHTENYIMVKTKSVEDLANEFVDVAVNNVEKDCLIGDMK
mgnify:CR=1 FL=1